VKKALFKLDITDFVDKDYHEGLIVLNQVEVIHVTKHDLYEGSYKDAKPLDKIFHYIQKVSPQ